MTRLDFDFVQSGINYQFKNLKLLQQAFIRKSYSVEHPEVKDNEVLEFYGDGILDFFVTKMMYKKFSKIVNNEFVSEKSEAELSKLKSILVSKESLAHCMYNFGFSNFLYLGKSDKKNEVQKNTSVNEDLFEAIIGAVAVDCNWDFQQLEVVCKTMLQMETINNYLTILVKEKSNALGFGEPIYLPTWRESNQEQRFETENLFNSGLGVQYNRTSKNPKTGKHEYGIAIGENKFKGVGEGTFQAKLDADQKAYHFLCQEEIKRHFKNTDFENSVSTLHELFQKKVIMEVRYEFQEYHDENGNPIWNCKAILEGFTAFSESNPVKKQAKQEVAKKLLQFITNYTIEKSDKWDIPQKNSGEFDFWSNEETDLNSWWEV